MFLFCVASSSRNLPVLCIPHNCTRTMDRCDKVLNLMDLRAREEEKIDEVITNIDLECSPQPPSSPDATDSLISDEESISNNEPPVLSFKQNTLNRFDLFRGVPGLFGPDSKWLACEELVLLTLLQTSSYGNWPMLAAALSQKFNKEFTAEEVHQHYINTYLEGKIAEAMEIPKRSTRFKSTLKDYTSKADDEYIDSVDINAHKNVPKEFLDEIGYMPLRGDFKEEYAPTAEDLIYYVSFRTEDKYDEKMNFLLLDAFRHQLKERVKWKKAITKGRLVEKYYNETKKSSRRKQDDNDEEDTSPSKRITRSVYKSQLSDSQNGEDGQIVDHNQESSESLDDSESVEESEESEECQSPKHDKKKRSNKHTEELAEDEKELCENLRLNETYYIRYKAFLQNIDRKKVAGELTNEPMIPEDMTLGQCAQIHNFLKMAGWIKNEDSLSTDDDNLLNTSDDNLLNTDDDSVLNTADDNVLSTDDE